LFLSEERLRLRLRLRKTMFEVCSRQSVVGFVLDRSSLYMEFMLSNDGFWRLALKDALRLPSGLASGDW
jgi:hypothetical protein